MACPLALRTGAHLLLLLLIGHTTAPSQANDHIPLDDDEPNHYPAYPPMPSGGWSGPSRCPGWLDDYARFHRANRGKPNATYLIFGPCSLTVRCTGLGDRVKSSMTLLRLAAIHKKVLLLSCDYPVPMTNFIEPNEIDWRYDEEMQAELQNITSVFDTGLDLTSNKRFTELILQGAHAEEFAQAKFVRSQAVRDFNLPMYGQTMKEINTLGYAFLGRCFFRFLFKPTADLMSRADDSIQRVYTSPSVQYVAWHWRTGGQVGELILDRAVTTRVEGTSRLHQLLAATQCASNMTVQAGLPPLSHTPMLMITDNIIIRQWVAEGGLANVLTVNQTVVHVRHKNVTGDDVMNGWVDIAMLARANCLLMSHSGFSWVALFMGNTNCWMDLKVCVHSQRKRFQRVDV